MLKICVGSNGKIPVKATFENAGYDLYSSNCVFISESDSNTIETDIKVIIPNGYYGKIEARSGFAKKYGMQILGGVIDQDYRGEIMVMCTSKVRFRIEKGERIAQLLIIPLFTGSMKTLSFSEFETNTTERNTGGFGSTGNT